jgi:hypothetical protein
MMPVTIIQFCLSCRCRTNHRLMAVNLYSCEKQCGSPWREIHNPNEKTEAHLKEVAYNDKLNQEMWARESAAAEFQQRKADNKEYNRIRRQRVKA